MTLVAPGRRWPPPPRPNTMTDVWKILQEDRDWSAGKWTADVEDQMRRITGAPHAVAFNSCTTAIHAALLAQDVRPDSWVLVPAFGFIGTITGLAHIGANLRFVDVGPDTLTSDCEDRYGNGWSVPVALHGSYVKPPRRGLVDACQALGTHGPDGKHIGATGTHAWSFSSAKLVTAPDGGAVTTDDERLAERLLALRDYGITDRGVPRALADVAFRHGYNWRPSEVTMCLVSHGLDDLGILTHRAANAAARLRKAAKRAGWWTQDPGGASAVAWHKVRVGPSRIGVRTWLTEVGVPTHRWGTDLGAQPTLAGPFPVPAPTATWAAGTTFCIGTEASPPWTWTDEEIAAVAAAIEQTGADT